MDSKSHARVAPHETWDIVFFSPGPRVLRWDKYESKLAFWFEEDVEAEWETSKTQTRREQTEFGVETTAGDALGEEPSNPTFEMADIRGATAG